MVKGLLAGLLAAAALCIGACQPSGRSIDPLPDAPMGALLGGDDGHGPRADDARAGGDGVTPAGQRKPAGEAGWMPTRPSSRWTHIVIHHSASAEGDAKLFEKWHKARGWDGLGYHFVIGNGRGSADGRVEVGYRWRDQTHGAHTDGQGLGVHYRAEPKYYNQHGVGICLVGDFMKTRPTEKQMRSLTKLCAFLMAHCRIPAAHIIGHYHTKSTTECPGKSFSFADLQRRLAGGGGG